MKASPWTDKIDHLAASSCGLRPVAAHLQSMVALVQSGERQIVILDVAGSIPARHPIDFGASVAKR